MKKIGIVLLVVFALFGIYSFVAKKPQPTKQDKGWVKFRQETIDGCEYVYFLEVVFGGGGGGAMCHKGNCSNPIHKTKTLQQENTMPEKSQLIEKDTL